MANGDKRGWFLSAAFPEPAHITRNLRPGNSGFFAPARADESLRADAKPQGHQHWPYTPATQNSPQHEIAPPGCRPRPAGPAAESGSDSRHQSDPHSATQIAGFRHADPDKYDRPAEY